MAKAKLSELDKMATQQWDLQMKAAGKLMEIQETEILLQKEKNKGRQVDYMGREITNVDAYTARLSKLKDQYSVLTGSIRSSVNAQEQLSKSINVSDLNLDVKGEKPKATPKPDNTLENNRKALENSLEEERKLRINASKITYTDENKSYDERFEALNKYIADSKANVIASANAEIETENNKYKTQRKNKKLSAKFKLSCIFKMINS